MYPAGIPSCETQLAYVNKSSFEPPGMSNYITNQTLIIPNINLSVENYYEYDLTRTVNEEKITMSRNRGANKRRREHTHLPAVATQNGLALAPLEGSHDSTTAAVATSIGPLPNYKILIVFILVLHKNYCCVRSRFGGL